MGWGKGFSATVLWLHEDTQHSTGFQRWSGHCSQCLSCSVDRASAFKVLLAMESILETVARGNEHSSLVDLILNGPVGHVTPRQMGTWAWRWHMEGACLCTWD